MFLFKQMFRVSFSFVHFENFNFLIIYDAIIIRIELSSGFTPNSAFTRQISSRKKNCMTNVKIGFGAEESTKLGKYTHMKNLVSCTRKAHCNTSLLSLKSAKVTATTKNVLLHLHVKFFLFTLEQS